jgi:hypothetical protein
MHIRWDEAIPEPEPTTTQTRAEIKTAGEFRTGRLGNRCLFQHTIMVLV